jgi:hypothetical protein
MLCIHVQEQQTMFVSPTILLDYQTPSPMLQDDALKIFQAREPRSLKEKQTKNKNQQAQKASG